MLLPPELPGLLPGSNQAPAQLPGKDGYQELLLDSFQSPTKLQMQLLGKGGYQELFLDSCQDPTKLQLSFQVSWILFLDSFQSPTKLQIQLPGKGGYQELFLDSFQDTTKLQPIALTRIEPIFSSVSSCPDRSFLNFY